MCLAACLAATRSALRGRLDLGHGRSIKAFGVGLHNGFAQQLFNGMQVFAFFRTDQRDGFTTATGTTGAANAMNIVFGHRRQVIVDHVRQVINVQSARSDVGGHQYAYLIALELMQRLGARTLRFIAVDGGGGEAFAIELLGKAISAMFGAREHQHLLPLVGAHQMLQQRALVALVHRVDGLVDGLGGSVARCHINACGLAQHLLGQYADLF